MYGWPINSPLSGLPETSFPAAQNLRGLPKLLTPGIYQESAELPTATFPAKLPGFCFIRTQGGVAGTDATAQIVASVHVPAEYIRGPGTGLKFQIVARASAANVITHTLAIAYPGSAGATAFSFATSGSTQACVTDGTMIYGVSNVGGAQTAQWFVTAKAFENTNPLGAVGTSISPAGAGLSNFSLTYSQSAVGATHLIVHAFLLEPI